MILKNLRVHNFRNLATAEVDFSDALNIFVGDNGQGKTSLLEAIYVLGCTKSFRTRQIHEAIQHGAADALISGSVWQASLKRHLTLALYRQGKRYFVNQRAESLLNYLGILDVLAITSGQMPIVTGYPEERRRFMDRIITALQPAYLHTILNYQRVLKQKNTLLRDMKEGRRARDADQIEAWNTEIIDYGAKMVQARYRFVMELKARLASQLFSQDVLKAKYLPMPNVDSLEEGPEAYRQALRARLTDKLSEEFSTGHALVGPHRDDLLVFLNGKSVQKFGSSGQKRSVLLALNIACLEIYHQTVGEFPLLIIDDIDAELDLSRIHAVLEYLIGKSQLFVSTAKADTVRKFMERGRTFTLTTGQIVRSPELAVGNKETDTLGLRES